MADPSGGRGGSVRRGVSACRTFEEDLFGQHMQLVETRFCAMPGHCTLMIK